MVVAVVSFAAAAALLILIPGPDNTLVLRNALRGGRQAGVRTAAGVLTGLMVWVVVAAAGLSAILVASRAGYDILRYVGAAYLLWLGAISLLSGGKISATDGEPDRVRLSGTAGYLTGMLTNLVNPKVGIFMITFLPAFIPPGAPVGPTSLLFGTIFAGESLLWFAVLLWLVGRAAGWLQRPTVQRRLHQLTGVVLIGFGLRLAAKSR